MLEYPLLLCARLNQYSIDHGLFFYITGVMDNPFIVVLHDEGLKYGIIYYTHDTALRGHLGRENTNIWLI